MSEYGASEWKELATAITSLALLPLSVFVDCWGLVKLWAWYVVPIGAHFIGKREAVGIAMIYLVFTYRGWLHEPKVKNPISLQLTSMVMTFIFVLVGWLAR